jgi:Tol biopolymer transport system component
LGICGQEDSSADLNKYASADKWELARSFDRAKVPTEWGNPLWLGEINSTGWEDGPYISADGDTLYFTYINVDLLKLPKMVITGPDRDPAGVGNPPCGQFPRSDVFYSQKDASGKWSIPVPHPLTIAYPIGGFYLVNENKAYFHIEKDNGLHTEIYFSEKINGKWQPPQKIKVLSSSFKDDDPYVTPDDNEIFFWSDRPAVFKGNNIYHAKKINGEWQKPELLPGPVNSDGDDMQPFLFGNTLYFSSDKDGAIKIYKTEKKDRGWSEPEVVISSKYGVGEPTLTKDGKYLYFIQIFKDDSGAHNPDIMFLKQKSVGRAKASSYHSKAMRVRRSGGCGRVGAAAAPASSPISFYKQKSQVFKA